MGVQLFRRVTAVLMLALWLPASAHCRLEAAGANLGTDCCGEASTPAAAPGCDLNVCSPLEGAVPNPASALMSVPAPVLCHCLFAPLSIPPVSVACSPPVTGIVEASTAPPEIVQSYHFVVRTALPARAPDSAS